MRTELSLFVEEDNNNNKESLGATKILDRNGNVIAEFSNQRQLLIKLNRIPYIVSRGFILVEDNRFYKHHGFNFVRMSIGTLKNIVTFGHSPGGSTISQQLAKILFTNQKKTIKRKIYEFFCTIELEKKFTKNEILQIYVNSIFFGNGIYGIEGASQFYFGKDASELNIAEASLLIGMNRAPEIYSPVKSIEKAKIVQRIVLTQFVKAGFLSKEQSKMEFDRFWTRFKDNGVLGSQSFWKTDTNRSGYVTEYVRQVLENEFMKDFLKDYNEESSKKLCFEKITQGGLTIETTIDINKQILQKK